jgi:hypothetical protein
MKRLAAILSILALLVALSAGSAAAAGPGAYTCAGGSNGNMATIPAGTYTSVTVTGICHILGAVTGPAVGPGGAEVITNCNVAGGPVDVLGTLTVAPGAFLDAGSCAPSVTVGGGIAVGSGGTLILGCEPFLVIMPPVPPFPTLCPGLVTHDSIGGGVTADHPLAMIFHENTITGGLTVRGGGGGTGICNSNGDPTPPSGDLTLSAALDSALAPHGNTPAYTDFEDNVIDGGVSISGMQGCWFGIFRNHVRGGMSVVNNTFADQDAMEVADNVVKGNLACFGNSPAVHFGDSRGGPNTVTGQQLGQCAPPLPL